MTLPDDKIILYKPMAECRWSRLQKRTATNSNPIVLTFKRLSKNTGEWMEHKRKELKYSTSTVEQKDQYSWQIHNVRSDTNCISTSTNTSSIGSYIVNRDCNGIRNLKFQNNNFLNHDSWLLTRDCYGISESWLMTRDCNGIRNSKSQNNNFLNRESW